MASTSASLLNFDGLSRDLGMPSNTVRSYAALLETLFLVARSEAWSSNLLSRAVEAPTVYIADSGLHGYVVGTDASRIVGDGQLAGMMFETFVVNELRRQIAWQGDAPRLFHYRDRDQRPALRPLVGLIPTPAKASVHHQSRRRGTKPRWRFSRELSSAECC